MQPSPKYKVQTTLCLVRAVRMELWGIVHKELEVELVLERCMDLAGCSRGEPHFRQWEKSE